MACDGARMADELAAAQAEFLTASTGCLQPLCLSRTRPCAVNRCRATEQSVMTDLVRGLQEPWPNFHLQREGVGLGMWVFLASEFMFFAGLFCTYAVYRSHDAEAFRIAGAHTKIIFGSINTVLLLTSSLT